jgi:integrase
MASPRQVELIRDLWSEDKGEDASDTTLGRWLERTFHITSVRFLGYDDARNPAVDVKPIKRKVEGWKPWPSAALERFTSKTTGAVRIAFMLALYTGQRRGDVLAMKWSDISDGGITVTQSKTAAVLWIPLHPILARELAEAKKATKGMTIVQRADGKPYTDSGFASVWNKAQHDHGCVGMPMHGLRKNATQALFEAGCTDKQVQAITGHETLEMLNLYGKGANQKRLAKQAMGRLENDKGE